VEIMEEFYDKVDRVAKSTSYKWEDLDSEDIRQDMWVWLLENPNEYNKLQDDDEDTRDKKLRRIGTQVAVAETRGYELYSGQYIYGQDEVRAMLELDIIFLTDHLDSVAERSDFALGMLELKERNPSYFKTIVDKFYKYKKGMETKSVARALAKLTLLMNQLHNRLEYSYEEGPGSRKVFTNMSAWSITGEW